MRGGNEAEAVLEEVMDENDLKVIETSSHRVKH